MIDLYQLHSVGSGAELDRVLAPGGACEALVEARAAGKIRWIGITGHSREIMLKAIGTGRFDTAQFPFNPIETEWEEEVIPAAKTAGVGTICMKPFAGGAIRNTGRSRCASSSARGMDVVIPGMDAIEQVEENAAVGKKLVPPSEAELAMLHAEQKLWGEKFCRRCGYCMPCPNGLNIPVPLSHRRLLHPLRAQGLGAREPRGAREEIRRLRGVRGMPQEVPVRARDSRHDEGRLRRVV